MERPSSDTLAASRAGTAPADLAAGSRIGRFVVEERLGAGAMGVVYGARDPQLGRQVAIKLVRSTASTSALARLLREAQAMARLAHPNVVVVHEAIELDGQVAVIMERVAGASLDEHLRRHQPGWRETLDLYLQAGRGLAAAHAGGIVHRDFKPSNVLVGADGRARVGDFGLARDAGDPSVDPATSPSLTSGPELTQTGAVLGTPAYMAPEQRRGERAGPAADVYSFCVALHEGLYGVRPVDGVAATAKGSPVPAAVRRALLGGLATSPDDRPPSMQALLDALSAARRPRRWLPIAAATTAVLVALAVAGTRGAAPTTPPCSGIEARLHGIWDAPRKQAVRERFLASTVPVAAARWSRIEEIVDGYTGSWVGKQRAICEAAEVRHELSSEEHALRKACLDARLEKLRAFLGVLAEADANTVKRSVEAALALDSLAACESANPFVAPRPDDPALAARVQELRIQFTAVDVRGQLGSVKTTRAALPQLHIAARALGYRPLEAEMLERLAIVKMNGGDFAGAVPLLEELRRIAEETRYDRMRALAWVQLTRAYAWLYKPTDAHRAASDAEAVLKPMSGEEAEKLRAQLASARADAFWDEGNFPEAVAHATAGLEGLERLFGTNDMRLVPRLIQRATLLGLAGRVAEAQADDERGLAILAAGGADEDNVLAPQIMTHIGDLAVTRDDHAAALDWNRRAYQRFERAFGQMNLWVCTSRVRIGREMVALGQAAEAMPELDGARSCLEQILPPDHPERAALYAALGKGALALGDRPAARRWLEQAIAIQAADKSQPPAVLAEMQAHLARARASVSARRQVSRGGASSRP